jgi:hypothetical protein
MAWDHQSDMTEDGHVSYPIIVVGHKKITVFRVFLLFKDGCTKQDGMVQLTQ